MVQCGKTRSCGSYAIGSQGYSAVWDLEGCIGSDACAKAAEYGQLEALQWLKQNGRDWDEEIVMLLLEVAISPSSNGRERMAVTGIVKLVLMLLEAAIYPSFNGRERMDVAGMRKLVSTLLNVVISIFSNGRERMDVTGILVVLVRLQILGAVSPASNGRERTDVQKSEDEKRSMGVTVINNNLKQT